MKVLQVNLESGVRSCVLVSGGGRNRSHCCGGTQQKIGKRWQVAVRQYENNGMYIRNRKFVVKEGEGSGVC